MGWEYTIQKYYTKTLLYWFCYHTKIGLLHEFLTLNYFYDKSVNFNYYFLKFLFELFNVKRFCFIFNGLEIASSCKHFFAFFGSYSFLKHCYTRRRKSFVPDPYKYTLRKQGYKPLFLVIRNMFYRIKCSSE